MVEPMSPPWSGVANATAIAAPRVVGNKAGAPVRAPGGGVDGARIRLEWQETSAVVDRVLRGPADQLLQDSTRIQCRLCGGTLTGNLHVDELVVANGCLVCAMDHAWAACERLHGERGALKRRALESRHALEELQQLVQEVRRELPEQVHKYVMRVIAPSRDRIVCLQRDLGALKAEGSDAIWAREGSCISPLLPPSREGAHSGLASAVALGETTPQADAEWTRFQASIKTRVTHWQEQQAAVVVASRGGDIALAAAADPASAPRRAVAGPGPGPGPAAARQSATVAAEQG